MEMGVNSPAQRVSVCVNAADDAAVLELIVWQMGEETVLHQDLVSMCREIAKTDVVVVGEEMFGKDGIAPLQEALSSLPERSELPVLLLISGGEESPLALQARERLDYVVPLCRPLRTAVLHASLRTALRARARQRQLVQLLEERLRLNQRLERRIEALRASHERFRRLYEANIIGIISSELGRIYQANDVFLDMVGYTRHELEAGLIDSRKMTPPEYRHLDDLAMDEMRRTGRCKPFKKDLYRKDGARVPILIGGTVLEREPFQWVSFVLDLTEQKRLESQVLQAQKLESLGLLAGGMAHDFNNLLTGIIGNATLVLDEVGPGLGERIREVIASAQRAAHLIRQLLAYAGKGQFVARDIDMPQALNEAADLLQCSIPKSANLIVHVHRGVPALRMDPVQLQQILVNLVINAGEAIGEGNSGEIVVSVSKVEVETEFVGMMGRRAPPGRYVCIEVNDTGIGISEEQKPKIFDPFFTTKFSGRGLGLAAVAGIVRAQNGVINVESAPGRGSMFRVYLPIAKASEEPQAQPEAARPTILVVDDETPVRNFFRAVLRKAGYRVLAASDGQEALTMLGRENSAVDGMVLDVVMPGMGANELLPICKRRWPHLRALLTSGYSEFEARRLCAAYPDTPFLPKPCTAQQIAEAVEKLLAKAEQPSGSRR